MGLFGLFGSKTKADLSLLHTDIHSHLIPGIDDGAKTMDHSLGMVKRFADLGYKKLITTPHVMSDMYRNTPEIILNGLESLREEVKRMGIPIELEAAAEYFYDEMLFEKIERGEILTFGNQYVLFEFAFLQKPMRENELIFAFQSNGYKPVLAHFERYVFYDSIKPAEEFKEKGVLIQLNLNSLTGHYGPQIKKQAERLIDAQLVDFAGSDCHRIEHLDVLEKHLSSRYFHKLLDLHLLNKTL
jgi:protein-tyrosine phosphatase